jgi:hypothetical protein
MHALLFST